MTEAQPLSLRTREYETIYILRPTAKPEDAERCASRVSEVITREKGKLTKVDNWGRRRLAYPIEGHSRGTFVYLRYLGEGGLVQELERNLRQFDQIVRFQTVKVGAGPEINTVAVDPEEVKFLPIESEEADEVLSAEERLGLPVDRGSSRMHGGGDDERDYSRDAGEEAGAPAADAEATESSSEASSEEGDAQ
ncbi:MAG: 30S ribosomal protein S6 [Polyangiales bacterium]|nr:30S ribosomal protein S6 [Myxococcales bacterium]